MLPAILHIDGLVILVGNEIGVVLLDVIALLTELRNIRFSCLVRIPTPRGIPPEIHAGRIHYQIPFLRLRVRQYKLCSVELRNLFDLPHGVPCLAPVHALKKRPQADA